MRKSRQSQPKNPLGPVPSSRLMKDVGTATRCSGLSIRSNSQRLAALHSRDRRSRSENRRNLPEETPEIRGEAVKNLGRTAFPGRLEVPDGLGRPSYQAVLPGRPAIASTSFHNLGVKTDAMQTGCRKRTSTCGLCCLAAGR